MLDEDASVISNDTSGKHEITDNPTLKPQLIPFYPLSSEKGSKYSLHAVQEEIDFQNEDGGTGEKPSQSPTFEKNAKGNRGFGARRAREQRSERAAFDYEDKYPEDPIYEETAPTARVWRTYLDESQKLDADRVGDWRETVDVLLVFAGLFSAVVSAFAVQFSQNLQPDYNQISAYLLFELVSIQQAISNGTSADLPLSSAVNPTANFTPATSIAWVNGLWFTSLSLSLSAALISVLVKQWLHHYMILPSGTPRERSHIRQYRYMGLHKWQVPLIIGLLPMLMHLALAFFFVGLVVFLGPMHIIIAWVTGGIGAIAYLFVIATNVLPFWFSQCPYRTPLADAAYIFASYFSQHVVPKLKGFFAEPLPGMPSSLNRIHIQSLNKIETHIVKSISDTLDVDALYWLYDMSSNPTVRSIVIQAIAGLPMGVSGTARQRFAGTDILEEQTALVNECLSPGPFEDVIVPVAGKEAKLERLLRFELHIPIEVSHLTRIPHLRLPEFSAPRLSAVVIASHFQTSVFVPLALRHAGPIQFILDLFDRKVDVQLPPLVWSQLVKRACDLNIGGMEQVMKSWISLSTALLEASAKDWSSPPTHAVSLHTPHVSTLRQAIIMYLYRDVVDNLLGTYTRAGCNTFARYHINATPRIQLLLAIIEFLLKIAFRHSPDSASGMRLFVSTMTDLERCVARYPSLTTDEGRGIMLGMDRFVQSDSNLFNAKTPRDSQLWSGRICILEIYCMMLGMPSRLRTGFLNFPLDIRHSLSLITMRKLIQVAFEDESWSLQGLSVDNNGNLNPTHQLYFFNLSQILRHCFRNRISVAYDAFEQIDCIKLSSNCQLHPEFVRILEAYIPGLASSSLDYAHRPDILPIICTTLACNNVGKAKGPNKALSELIKKRPGDPSWDICRKRLLELAQGESDSTDWFKRQKVDGASLSEVRTKICDAVGILERHVITAPDMVRTTILYDEP
ncbi:uncharacterized protein ARMOST_14492 [Armillaria ostoyae]|uniref:DUF6535 domain-containing protein n=1 Tax=Armillaria ostoyae TaxID=47428 RepID=A0A284RQN7_ARMOS|nr:uncharacterized protein ARMOST_14492 [Armillaria ostoyae]